MANGPNVYPSPAADEASFRQLFEETYAKLVTYARRRSFDASAVDDVVSEVYATAWRRWADREPDKAPLPWLYGIAGNVLRNQWRADNRRLQLVERLEAQPIQSVAPDPADVDPSREVLRTALSKLTFDDQEVLRLVAWEGLSHAEVGQVLDCTANAVGIRVHRAKQRLENQLSLDEELARHMTDQHDPGPGGTEGQGEATT